MKQKRDRSIDREIGARLRMLRVQRGLSQDKMAMDLGITFQMVQKYESGTCSFSSHRIVAICNILNTTPNELFKGLYAASNPHGQKLPLLSVNTTHAALQLEHLPLGVRGHIVSLIGEIHADAIGTK